MHVNEFKLTLVFSTAADLAAFSAHLAGNDVPVTAQVASTPVKKGGTKAKATPAADPQVMPPLGGAQQPPASPFGNTHAATSLAPTNASQPAQNFQGHGQQPVAKVDRENILGNVSQTLDKLEQMGVPESNVGQLMTNAFGRIGKTLGRVGMLNDEELAAFYPAFVEYASPYIQQAAPAARGFM